MAERQQQGEPVARIDLQCTRLDIEQPPFGNQIVEERMQASFADMRGGSARQGECDSGMPGLQVGRVIGEYTALARLLTQFASVELVVVDLAPKRSSHEKYVLSSAAFKRVG
jgi:hypothetical protein